MCNDDSPHRVPSAVHSHHPIPEVTERLLVWAKNLLHRAVSIRRPEESLYPLPVPCSLPSAIADHLSVLLLNAEESRKTSGGAYGQQLSGSEIVTPPQ